jgi:hypothetical protein
MYTPVPQSPPFLERFLEALFCQTVKHSLRFGLDLLTGLKPASFQLQFHFWEKEEVTGCQMWGGVRWGGDDSHLFFARNSWVRTEV